MASADEILRKLPGLVKKQDAAALAGLRDHADKKVRKAVRKAIHGLKSKGVEVPDDGSRSWSTGDALQELRGSLEPCATVDARSVPGALSFLISHPEQDEGGRLWTGVLTPDDRVLQFQAYTQTDGQRTRMIRDWDRRHDGRTIPVPWVSARLRWAREQTVRSGFSVPRALDDILADLGELPPQRPATPERSGLDAAPAFEADKVDDVLVALRAHQWPVLMELDDVLKKAAEIHGDKPQPEDETERAELLRKSVEGNDTVREALGSTIANTLDDASVAAWLEGEAATARAAGDMAAQLRDADSPETLPWVARLLGYQVASLLRAMGPDAIRQAQQQRSETA